MKSIKNILKSPGYKEFSLAQGEQEHLDYFTAMREGIVNQEDAYTLIIMGLARKTYIGYGYEIKTFFKHLIEVINAHKLDQKIILSWVPEIFDQARYAGDHGDFHDFFTQVLTDKKIYQDYLRAVEPRIFSWEEWFKVIKAFSSSKDAEQAMIKQFLSDDHLERFQGNIYDTEWRIHFLERVLKYCDKQKLLNIKNACWKILADEAVYGMNAEWLINNYGYEDMMGTNKDKFEKRYLSNALTCLTKKRGLFGDDYYYRKAWELDFDTSVFKKTRKLKKFLKIRHQLRETDGLRIIEDSDNPVEMMHSLHKIYQLDSGVINGNKELSKTFSEIPKTILIGLKENNIKLEGDDLILLKKEPLWAKGIKDIDSYLASQGKEISLMQNMQILAKNYDSGFINLAKQLQDIGFDNFERENKNEFLDQFLNANSLNLPKFFDESNYIFSQLDYDGGMRDNNGDWIGFDEWSGRYDWEPGSNRMEESDQEPIDNPDQGDLF